MRALQSPALAGAVAFACAAVFAASARDLVWTGAESGAWDLSTPNWRVKGDETLAPVAFQSGDNVLFDDTAARFSVSMSQVDAENTFQFNVGSVVVSNDVNSYSLTAFKPWYEVRGTVGTVDKWGAGDLSLDKNSEWTENLTIHQGRILAKAGTDWVGQWYSVLGSLHHTRTISVLSGGTLRFDKGFVFGGPLSATKTSFVVDGGTLAFNTAEMQNFGPTVLRNASFSFSSVGALAFSDNLAVEGSSPCVIGTTSGGVEFGRNQNFIDVTVRDVAAGDDFVVSNKLVDAFDTNGSTVWLMNQFNKKGAGTMTLCSAASATTGGFAVVEGVLKLDAVVDGYKSNFSSALGSVCTPGRARRVRVRDGGEIFFARNNQTGLINTPMNWELVVSNATLRMAANTCQGFGSLVFYNADFQWSGAPAYNWFHNGLMRISSRLSLDGTAPYDWQPKGDNRGECFIYLGTTPESIADGHPIAEAAQDSKYAKFTNMWSVVDFDVADITGDSAVDATIGLRIFDMPNLAYVTIDSANTWNSSPYKNYRYHGGIRKTGAGTLRLNGNSGYTHTTEVASGALVVDGSIASSSGVAVDAGAYLGGTGVVSSVTIADGGGILCSTATARGDVLRVASLTAADGVAVRVANPTGASVESFRRPVLAIAAKPASVDFSGWTVSYEGVERAPFAFLYDAGTGIVSVRHNGGLVFTVR